ncbi:hypothetical protein [Pontibacter beigongshangensis]|uniref:hypothetical protein n=1 Tax=Pontibacter beigongshangensis TaxID=2574733 RepID=UPI001650A053|nr:hypothetical protein [Pontibacter beigongshangensis]
MKSTIFETALALLVPFAIILSVINYIPIEGLETAVSDPFADYYSNPGIRRIHCFKTIAWFSFLLFFTLQCFDKYRKNTAVLTTYLTSAFAIAALQWFELYFGSTFYYGEVRDKQGLGFPVLSSFMVTLVIWKINYSTNRDIDLTIKLILTGVINFSLYQLYLQVYEPWKLWQS